MDQKDSHIKLANGYIENTLNSSDKEKFLLLLEDEVHALWFEDYQKIYKASENYGKATSFDVTAALSKFDAAVLAESTPDQKAAKLVKLSSWKNIAASLIILLVAGFGLMNYLDRNNSTVVEMAYLDSKELSLEDGSVITLNTNAEISYRSNSFLKNRKLQLKGEAYFDVAKLDGADFLVSTNHLDVKVLGTAFSVIDIEGDNTATVIVEEGKVNVSFFSLSIDLVAGEKLVVDHASQSYKKISSINLNELSWATKQLRFKDTPLKNVFEDISSHYKVSIEYPEAQLASCLYTSPLAFNDTPIGEVLSVIQLAFNMKMEQIDDDKYSLSGGSCQ